MISPRNIELTGRQLAWSPSTKKPVEAEVVAIPLFSNKTELIQDIERICEILECSFEHLIFYEDNQRVIQDLQRLNLNVISV